MSDGQSYGRCEPWAPERATQLEVINVVGRFRDSSVWAERTEVSVLEDDRASTAEQAATAKRRAFAQKRDQVERLAFVRNVPTLPFTDEAMASSVGKTIGDFATMPVEPAHLSVVFDALAHSKTTLVSRADADERISSWRREEDGGLDTDAFGAGLRKGMLAVLAANLVLYFFLASGVAIAAKVILDAAT